MFEIEKLELTALLQGSGQIPKLAIDHGDDSTFKQRLGDALGDGRRSSLPRHAFFLLSVGKRDSDFIARFRYAYGQSSRIEG